MTITRRISITESDRGSPGRIVPARDGVTDRERYLRFEAAITAARANDGLTSEERYRHVAASLTAVRVGDALPPAPVQPVEDAAPLEPLPPRYATGYRATLAIMNGAADAPPPKPLSGFALTLSRLQDRPDAHRAPVRTGGGR
jgi:hypothetical protein